MCRSVDGQACFLNLWPERCTIVTKGDSASVFEFRPFRCIMTRNLSRDNIRKGQSSSRPIWRSSELS